MKSRQDLIREAFEQVAKDSAPPSAEDAAGIDRLLIGVLDDLSERGIYAFGSPDKIEDAHFIHLSTILAEASAHKFGSVEDKERRRWAENRLMELNTEADSGEPVRAFYF